MIPRLLVQFSPTTCISNAERERSTFNLCKEITLSTVEIVTLPTLQRSEGHHPYSAFFVHFERHTRRMVSISTTET